MGKKEILAAITPFYSENMERHCGIIDFSDNTVLGIEVMGRNGYRLNISLGDLRRLWAVKKQLERTANNRINTDAKSAAQ
jgi:hypothetical protein